ncbi:GNAT family N-acetyltransferase [Rhizobium mayense]|uniref:GNAT family N-acetyltransferase n=1 Tax=Rhizobium mayense TaxID=1312184 RepID=A0ABT7JS62_9HYPH|nr:GNAT family N-acetyltransferase [Rhizobium mayense]MDL2399193.1 GNAT family N-acetyltransferase [Rhizobium mayense]
MSFVTRCFTPADYLGARSLWETTDGVGLSSADEEHAILAYLARNPGLSFVAEDKGNIVGTILVGHDGRRGLIHHLAVAASHRRQGIAKSLLDAGIAALREAQIEKCHLYVFEDNANGRAFWEAAGASRRVELALYSLPVAAPLS